MLVLVQQPNINQTMDLNIAKMNNLKDTNTLFHRKTSKEWTWKKPNGKRKNEIHVIPSDNVNIIRHVVILNILRSSDNGIVV